MPRLLRARPSPYRSPVSRNVPQRILVAGGGFIESLQPSVGVAEVVEGLAFAVPVAGLREYLQRWWLAMQVLIRIGVYRL